jgi:hypothetical protein
MTYEGGRNLGLLSPHAYWPVETFRFEPYEHLLAADRNLMAPIRHWSGLRLAVTWLAAVVSCGVVWRILDWGTIEGRIIDFAAAEISGQWSSSFASGAMGVFVMATVVALGITTVVWLRGRGERATRRQADESADNRILIGPPRPNLRKGFFQR